MAATTRAQRIAAAAAIAIAATGVLTGVYLVGGGAGTPAKPTQPTCTTFLADPAATIAALPNGGTFNGDTTPGDCYDVGYSSGPGFPSPGNIQIDQNNVTINGGVYVDTDTSDNPLSITNVALTSDVATLTVNNNYNGAGQAIRVVGLSNTEFNGNWTLTGSTSSTVSFALTHADVASTADSGTIAAGMCYDAGGPAFEVINRSGAPDNNSATAGANDTIENVTVIGQNTTGVFDGPEECLPGIELNSSTNTHLTNDTMFDTWGDGLTLWDSFGDTDGIGAPTKNLTSTNLSVVGAGRDGVGASFVNGAVFTNTFLWRATGSPVGISFESDTDETGSGNVTFNNCLDNWFPEYAVSFTTGSDSPGGPTANTGYLQGPVTFNNCTLSGIIQTSSQGPNKATNQITFENSNVKLPNATGAPSAILDGNGYMNFTNDVFSREPGTVTAPMYIAQSGAVLTFTNSPLLNDAAPGTSDSISQVNILP